MPPSQYKAGNATVGYAGRTWAQDITLWAEEVRANIKRLEERINELEKKQGLNPTDFNRPWKWNWE